MLKRMHSKVANPPLVFAQQLPDAVLGEPPAKPVEDCTVQSLQVKVLPLSSNVQNHANSSSNAENYANSSVVLGSQGQPPWKPVDCAVECKPVAPLECPI
jgi:hypothetical protein